MLVRIQWFGLGATAFFLACTPAEAPTADGELLALEDTIVSLMNGYAEALASLDAEAITAFYDEDPVFRVYVDGEVSTRADLAEQVAGLASALQSIEARWDDIHVTPLGHDAALGSSRFERTLVAASGDTIRDWGTATWVWVRRPAGWRIIHGHGAHYPGTLQ